MSNIIKKLERLEELKDSVLKSIQSSCEHQFSDQERLVSECEIIHQNEVVGSVKYVVGVDVLIPHSIGDYDTPPDSGEYDFVLDNCKVDVLLSKQCIPLTNLTNQLNQPNKSIKPTTTP